MGIYLSAEFIRAAFVFLVLSGVVFTILHISGDPVALLMPADATPDQMDGDADDPGLDKPLWVQ